MKTLQQAEPRTPISSLPFTILQSGSYYPTGNLTGVSGTANRIEENQIYGSGAWGIRADMGGTNVIVKNSAGLNAAGSVSVAPGGLYSGVSNSAVGASAWVNFGAP